MTSQGSDGSRISQRGRRQLPKGVLQPIITVRNSSCGKVMFSQACVKNSVGGGRVWQGACMARGGHVWGAWRGIVLKLCRIQDFPEGAPTLEVGVLTCYFANFLPKTLWEMKEFGPRGGGRTWRPTLDPPM